jgi:hypothetical protein
MYLAHMYGGTKRTYMTGYEKFCGHPTKDDKRITVLTELIVLPNQLRILFEGAR